MVPISGCLICGRRSQYVAVMVTGTTPAWCITSISSLCGALKFIRLLMSGGVNDRTTVSSAHLHHVRHASSRVVLRRRCPSYFAVASWPVAWHRSSKLDERLLLRFRSDRLQVAHFSG